MNVWCQIDCLNDKRSRVVKTLWIQIDMPVLMPIGSTVYMPTPINWEDICGSLICRVAGYTLMGSVIECKADPIMMVFGDDFSDMLSIGYVENEPEELKAAFETTRLIPANGSGKLSTSQHQ